MWGILNAILAKINGENGQPYQLIITYQALHNL
jgi:hypothetical protein